RWACPGWLGKKPDCPLTCAESIRLWRGFRVRVELHQRSHPLPVRSPAYKKIGPLGHRATPVLPRACDQIEDPSNRLYSFREQLYSILEHHFKGVSSNSCCSNRSVRKRWRRSHHTALGRRLAFFRGL